MTLVRWDPWEEFRSIRRAMDRLWDELMGRREPVVVEEAMTFPVDMYETDEALVVKAALPGLRPEDVEISVQGDLLTIKGELKREEKVERENYHRRELRYGMCSRTISLPVAVDAEKAEATFEHGILTVTLPKVPEARAKVIRVKAR
ncbi:MAG: Hsp20/alpha crystallin family protein [Dehalococcoidia bacterium]|jgi:HSP20 family protein|nr:Hsp20/alpha crystallin family protein [Dehalococcoidia bacterium]